VQSSAERKQTLHHTIQIHEKLHSDISQKIEDPKNKNRERGRGRGRE